MASPATNGLSSEDIINGLLGDLEKKNGKHSGWLLLFFFY
jgi:hypothetical protein